MPRMKLVEAGSNPLDDPIHYRRRGLPWLIILSGLGLAVVLGLKIASGTQAKKAAAMSATATAMVSPTATQTPTVTPTPTVTATGILEGAFDNVQGTGRGLANLRRDATLQPTLSLSRPTCQAVEVTRVVQGSCPACNCNGVKVTQLVERIIEREVTRVVTSTPMPTYTAQPTYTPWIVYITVEVTSTPTQTATATPTPTVTATETPTLEVYPAP